MPWKVRRPELVAGNGVGSEKPPFTIKTEVGRVENPPAAAFKKRYVDGNKPVLLTGCLEQWRALSAWTPEYMHGILGDHKGEVIISTNGLFPDYLTKPEPMKKVDMPFDELMRRAQSPGELPPIVSPEETYYIYGKPYLFEAAPELRADVPAPDCLNGLSISGQNIWLSSTGCVTPLHYDLVNGLLCQVRGSKQVILFSPKQGDLLYQRGKHFPGLDNFERQSQIDIFHPDFEKYPKFKEARAIRCILKAGDALFIPSNWYHEVETLEFSISVNFTFPGGTQTSQFADMAEAMKQGKPMDFAAMMQNPEMLKNLMELPMMKELMNNPAMLSELTKMMPGKK